MELDSEGAIAEQEVKGHFMDEVSCDVENPQGGQWHGANRNLEHPWQGQDRQSFNGLVLVCVTGSVAGGKQTVGHHQNGDEAKKEDGVGRAALAILCGHRIPRGLENEPTDRSHHHTKKDDRRRVVRNKVVDAAPFSGETWHHETGGDSHNQHSESASCQKKESCEDQNVESTSESVARMFPLSQPELEDFSQAGQWPVKTRIALSAHQWN